MLGLVKSGQSAAASTGYGGRVLRPHYKIDKSDSRCVRLGLVKTISGLSAAARTGQGAERCGHTYQIDKEIVDTCMVLD